YYVFDMFAVRDHIYRVISRAVFRLRPERKNEWDEAQKNASEGSAITLISKLVGGAPSFGPLHYQWPPTPSPKKNWRECDGVVIAEVDEHLFIVEVKAGAFTYTAPANDFPAHIVSANALIDTPLGQGRKLLEYLQSADEVPIFDGDHHEVARLRHDRFKTILLCGITLDAISDLAAQAEHLKPLGVDVGSTPVWSVSLDDLRVMRDLLTNPLIFLHYLRQRRRAVASPIIRIDDELDHLALYLTHNDYLAVAQRLGGTQPPIWNAYKESIDHYYHALLTDPPTAVIPSQKMPGLLRRILDVLASEPKPGRFDVAATLLDLDPKGRSQVAMMIDGSLARQRNTGRVMPTSAYGATPLTIFCWHDSVVSRDAVYARELTLGVASLAGEEQRLLLELTFDADETLVGVDFEWLRPASIAPDERTRIDELARNIYEQRVSKQEKKIGRNDPCPCGSGKKYKKCHGA
ncbi:MAG TPA: SEC-C metal-binding domain-containing protein, partial [Thermoanaerobaculia bacterium]